MSLPSRRGVFRGQNLAKRRRSLWDPVYILTEEFLLRYEGGNLRMSVTDRLQQALETFSQAVTRIFRPSEDQYPETGEQPYEGDPYDQRQQD